MPTFEQASAQAVSLLQKDGYSVTWTQPDMVSGGGLIEASALGSSASTAASGIQYEAVLVSPLPADADAEMSILRPEAPAGITIRQDVNIIWVSGNAGQMRQFAEALNAPAPPPDPAPSASAASGDPVAGSGTGPACTTVAGGYFDGGLPGHEDSTGFCVPDK